MPTDQTKRATFLSMCSNPRSTEGKAAKLHILKKADPLKFSDRY